MIPKFNDHAANERTYLAWLRTGISVIAFGFVLERFDLFLNTIVHTLGEKGTVAASHGGREAGMALVVMGLCAIAGATWRFASNARNISSDETCPYSPRSALALGGLIIVLGLLILVYVSRLLIATEGGQ
jgi:putative membrane protein